MKHWQPRFDFQHPPGTYEQWLDHPKNAVLKFPIGITHEHRFAFYFWGRWLSQIEGIEDEGRPDLITIDWHRDLALPTDQEKNDLEDLDLSDSNELSLFCWGYLNPHNDDHVLSAAYKNLIGDIYVLCKQKFASPTYIKDYAGNTHGIYIFDKIETLTKSVEQVNQLYLDLDLDYFTETDSFMGLDADLELEEEESIRKLINPNNDFFKQIISRLLGMTIALEPKFCGGYRNSIYLFDIVDDQLFNPPLLHPEAGWNN
jgi:hypothetical protein